MYTSNYFTNSLVYQVLNYKSTAYYKPKAEKLFIPGSLSVT